MESWKRSVLVGIAYIYQCRNDQRFTLETDIDDLEVLLGRSLKRKTASFGLLDWVEEEWHQKIHDQIQEQLSTGDNVEVLMPVRKQDGDILWLLNRGHRVKGAFGEETLAGVLVDLTYSKQRYDEEKQVARILEEQAKRDSLTRLYNAKTTRQLAESYLTEASGKTGCALCILDLDDFKQINDQYGHMFGDDVLVQVAQTVQRLFRSKDIVGRIGGEEFLILMKDVTDPAIVEGRCRQLNEAFHDILIERLQGETLSCSIGVAFTTMVDQSYFEMFCNADQALYLAKDLGKDRYVFYDPEQVAERKGKYAKRFADFR